MPNKSNDEKDLLTHRICEELVEAMLEADRNRCESLIEGALLNNPVHSSKVVSLSKVSSISPLQVQTTPATFKELSIGLIE